MKKNSKKAIKHLKGDIKTFKHEAQEDRKLIKSLKKSDSPKHEKKESKKHEKKELKVKKVMKEYKQGKLHSGSKKGPQVTNPKQAIAIALSESRKVKEKSKKRK